MATPSRDSSTTAPAPGDDTGNAPSPARGAALVTAPATPATRAATRPGAIPANDTAAGRAAAQDHAAARSCITSDLVRQRRGRAIERDHRRVPSRVDRAEGALRDGDVRSDANARRHTPAAFLERRDRELRFPPGGAKHEHGSKHHRVTRVGRGGERGSRCANGSDNRAELQLSGAAACERIDGAGVVGKRDRLTGRRGKSNARHPVRLRRRFRDDSRGADGTRGRPAHRPAGAREGTEPIACARIGSRVEDDSHLRCRRQCPPDKRTPQIATSDVHAGRDRRPNRAPQQRRNRRHRDHTEGALARPARPLSA